ncbi:beta-galactosidase [Eubacteriales bacterium OttesenSCG-928-N13]|nr:beta-galactosidase [Eubacteriales bacterium OttesenSCG-928-N13]
MNINLSRDWQVLQDVHDDGEALGIFRPGIADHQNQGNQLSEWDELPELKHLQLVYAQTPYFGRALRYFNQAPWWYQKQFTFESNPIGHTIISFSNADYHCKVWLNGCYLGAHEGYSNPFSMDATSALLQGKNLLTVKVSSPWDDQVADGSIERRTFHVERNMVKGTYEHADTFVPRDVNPIGLYGQVTLTQHAGAFFDAQPRITYDLDVDAKRAQVRVETHIAHCDAPCTLHVKLIDKATRQLVMEKTGPAQSGECALDMQASGLNLWNTWDHGGAWLYEMHVSIEQDGETLDTHVQQLGFRDVQLLRDESRTQFQLNGKRFYVRGTSYYPDLYISAMTKERYRRDLMAMQQLGFNLLRVHVHVELPEFYALCDELGIAVMQDSEFNWTHPSGEDFAARFEQVLLDTIGLLMPHPSIVCWILMNEPNLMRKQATMDQGQGLYQSVRAMDPTRPVIRGSYLNDDPLSGDSHNYTGSLHGHATHYQDIFGTTEKLNTEYGFDAPPTMDILSRCPEAAKRLHAIADQIPQIQQYQYALLKYYTEHYRMQKYRPNAGYVQFLFSDLCPQSFYGLYDYWGLPKLGVLAMQQSNQPLGVFLKYHRESACAVFAVNDSDDALGDVRLIWMVTDESGATLSQGEAAFHLGADDCVQACEMTLSAKPGKHMDVSLILYQGDRVIARNQYIDLFHMPEHVAGHPERMTHELGMRLYFA